MKKIVLFIIVLILVAAGYWGYKYYLSYKNNNQPHQEKTKATVTYATNSYIHSREVNKFATFIHQTSPSGIIILVAEYNATGQDICGDEKRRHKIIIVNKNNPHLNELKRWGINPQRLYAPYTIIIKDGNIIIQSSGIICTY